VARRNLAESPRWNTLAALPEKVKLNATIDRLVTESWRNKLEAMLLLHDIGTDDPHRWKRLAAKVVRASMDDPEAETLWASLLKDAKAGPHGAH
jgi:hypothetical protein